MSTDTPVTPTDLRLPEQQAAGIDPRGPQFTASVTAVVLLVALLVGPSGLALGLVAVQTACFAIGALWGVQHTPTALVFRTLVRPQLAAPTHLEDPRPPRFAQGVGLVFGVVALAGLLAGVDTVALVALGLALVAALLNALFRFCLGCELYLMIQRAVRQR